MTPDQSELLRLADDSIAAAKLLLQNGYAAFASSRVYYAMFMAAEALLLSKDLSFSKHSAVIAAFGRHFAKTGIVPTALHRAILDAKADREAADYGGGKQVTREDAERHVRNAEDLVRDARGYLEKEPRAEGQ